MRWLLKTYSYHFFSVGVKWKVLKKGALRALRRTELKKRIAQIRVIDDLNTLWRHPLGVGLSNIFRLTFTQLALFISPRKQA